jgi:serine/threonine protein kinase
MIRIDSDSTEVSAADFTLENTIGRFQIEQELGRGGFGIVFRAYDPELDRHVALKIPRFDTLSSPQLQKSLLREAKAAAGLDHPNIVPIYEVGESGSLTYIALAYCEGQNLDRWLSERSAPVSSTQVAQLIATLSKTVEYAHQRGILHRDLKPSNVMMVPNFDQEGTSLDEFPFTPRITDFGMAKSVEAALTQTRSSIFVGTPLYMAPEQAEGRARITPAADIYALGVIMYELLTGQLPFEGDSMLRVLDRLRSDEPPISPRTLRLSIPAELETICLKCLRKDPHERYPSAAELAADLERFLKQEPIRARQPSRWERFRNWAKRPQRIREAGSLMISLNSIVGIWVLVNPILFSWGLLTTRADVSGVWLDSVRIGSIHWLCVWLGFKMLQEKRYAIWLGTLFSAGLFVLSVYFSLGFGRPFGGFYDDELALLVIFNMLCTLLAIQLSVCVLAVMADRAKQRVD